MNKKVAKIKFADHVRPRKIAGFSHIPLKNARTPFARSFKFGLNSGYLDSPPFEDESF